MNALQGCELCTPGATVSNENTRTSLPQLGPPIPSCLKGRTIYIYIWSMEGFLAGRWRATWFDHVTFSWAEGKHVYDACEGIGEGSRGEAIRYRLEDLEDCMVIR